MFPKFLFSFRATNEISPKHMDSNLTLSLLQLYVFTAKPTLLVIQSQMQARLPLQQHIKVHDFPAICGVHHKAECFFFRIREWHKAARSPLERERHIPVTFIRKTVILDQVGLWHWRPEFRTPVDGCVCGSNKWHQTAHVQASFSGTNTHNVVTWQERRQRRYVWGGVNTRSNVEENVVKRHLFPLTHD